MFEQTFVNGARKGRQALSLVGSCFAQTAIVLLLLIVPLVYTERLPRSLRDAVILPPLPQIRQQTPPPAGTLRHAVSRTDVSPDVLRIPSQIPARVLMIDTDSAPPLPSSIGYEGGVVGAVPVSGVPGGVDLGGYRPPPPPPPVKPPVVQAPAPGKPVPVGGDVQRAKLLRQPLPVYPALARQARISGTVRLLGVISREGTIERLQVVSGHPMLIPAAVEAVRQWLYRPTLLNGEPVEVIAPIDVNFRLGN